ncbi:Ribosomal RNA processing protein 1 homolog B [Linum grandiflorum]
MTKMAETQLQIGPALIKQLGASDNRTRSRSLRALLSTWLPFQSTLSDDDMKKLWKGLFYCFWHSDKLPAQTHLIDRLTSLLPVLDLPLSAHYFSVFLLTMRREWPGIDFLRLDKFYLLIRRFFRSLFLLLKKNSWNLELSNQFVGIVLERAFLADDKFQGNGVNYHIASVYLEELKPFLPLSKPVVQALVLPLVSVMGKAVDKVLLGKLKSNVFDELLKKGRALLELKKLQLDGDSESDKDVVFLGTIALAMGFSAIFYEVGSSADCPQGNRKVLLGLHEEFLQLEKSLALSGIQVSLPEVNSDDGDDDDDEVPTLVPIMDVSNGFGEKKSKKNKKRSKDSSDNDGKDKKEKKKKNKKRKKQENGGMDGVIQKDENSSKENGSDVNDVMTFNDDVIANLQMQFEKVAAEVGLENDAGSPLELVEANSNGHVPKKRKRSKSKAVKQSENHESKDKGDAAGAETGKSGDKSEKKVRFAMKNNLVWKPHNPLPPESLRIPPSVTPRGSALKKGLSPGPIREVRSGANKARKRAKSLKGRRGIPPTIRRMKKSNSL